MENEILSSINPVNMEDEMFNDGLYFLEQGKNATVDSVKWRNYRFAIVSIASSFEAYLNKRILHAIKNDINFQTKYSKELSFLESGTGGITDKLRNINSKVETLTELKGVAIGLLINDKEYKNFKNVIKMRNNIVHYAHSKFNDLYGEELERVAVNSPDLLRKVIGSYSKAFCEAIPEYYNNKKYRLIE